VILLAIYAATAVVAAENDDVKIQAAQFGYQRNSGFAGPYQNYGNFRGMYNHHEPRVNDDTQVHSYYEAYESMKVNHFA
jgi:hypothetical protein